MVEHSSDKGKVEGSIPSTRTHHVNLFSFFLARNYKGKVEGLVGSSAFLRDSILSTRTRSVNISSFVNYW